MEPETPLQTVQTEKVAYVNAEKLAIGGTVLATLFVFGLVLFFSAKTSSTDTSLASPTPNVDALQIMGVQSNSQPQQPAAPLGPQTPPKTAKPSPSPTLSATPTPSPSPSPTPSLAPTNEPTPVASTTPSPTPSPEPTDSPSPSPSPTP